MLSQSGGGAGFRSTSWGKPTQKKSAWPKVLVGLLVVAAVGGYLAWYLLGEAKGGTPDAACALVIDRTASSANDATVERYRHMVERAVDGCAEEDAVLTAYVFDSSTSGAELIGRYDLFEPEGRVASKRESQQEAAVNEARDEILGVFDEGSAGDGRGDILAAFNAAAESLQQSRAANSEIDETFLVMVTDGLQLSSGVSVEELAGSATPEDLVEVAQDLQSVPSIEGTAVTFAGTDEGVNADGQPLDDAFEALVQQFWRQLTDAGGGTVCTYGPDPDSLPAHC